MKRAAAFLAGLAIGLTVPAGAREAYVRCAPVLQDSWGEACANGSPLQSYFNHNGYVPNRCKVS